MPDTYTYTFADQSGITADSTDPDPYNALLKACDNEPAQISAVYEKHRTTRAVQQRQLLKDPDFKGVTIDPTLREILDEEARPEDEKTGYTDPRHCAVLWGRPPERVKELIAECQRRMKEIIPSAYFQPIPNLHITVLELAHSLTPKALSSLLSTIPTSLIEAATDLPHSLAQSPSNPSRLPARARLNRPMITYDGCALAISFLPVIPSAPPKSTEHEDPSYTYHHLRSGMHNLFTAHRVPIASRYVVPSAHMTIARFVSTQDTSTDGASDPAKMQAVVLKIEDINEWLGVEYGGGNVRMGEWTVGEEVGLCFRVGTVWYGGGESLREGNAV